MVTTQPFTRLSGLRQFIDTRPTPPQRMTPKAFAELAADERESYNQQRLAWINSGVVVDTHQVAEVRKNVKRLVRSNRGKQYGRRGLILSGAATVGKTTDAAMLASALDEQKAREVPHFRRDGLVPMVYIEVPPSAHPRAVSQSICDFFQLQYPARATKEDLLSLAVDTLIKAQTQVLFIDEVHNLKLNSDNGSGQAADVFKAVMNRVPATCVFSGIGLTNGGVFTGPRGEQISERCSLVDLVPYSHASDVDRAQWLALVEEFGSHMFLIGSASDHVGRHAPLLHGLTAGRIGGLAGLLGDAAAELVYDPKAVDAKGLRREIVTKDLLSDLRPSYAVQRLAQPAPARSGRRRSA